MQTEYLVCKQSAHNSWIFRIHALPVYFDGINTSPYNKRDVYYNFTNTGKLIQFKSQSLPMFTLMVCSTL